MFKMPLSVKLLLFLLVGVTFTRVCAQGDVKICKNNNCNEKDCCCATIEAFGVDEEICLPNSCAKEACEDELHVQLCSKRKCPENEKCVGILGSESLLNDNTKWSICIPKSCDVTKCA